jgi:hypothetical protein
MRTFPRSTIGLATPWEYRRPNPRKVHLLRACGNGSLVRAQIRRRFSNRPNTPVSTPPLTAIGDRRSIHIAESIAHCNSKIAHRGH